MRPEPEGSGYLYALSFRGRGAVGEEAFELEEVLLVEVVAEPCDEGAQGADDEGAGYDGERFGVGVGEEGRAEAVGEEGVDRVVEDVEAVAVLAEEAERLRAEDAGRAAGRDEGHSDEGGETDADEGGSEGLLEGAVVEAEAAVGEGHEQYGDEAKEEDPGGDREDAVAVSGAEQKREDAAEEEVVGAGEGGAHGEVTVGEVRLEEDDEGADAEDTEAGEERGSDERSEVAEAEDDERPEEVELLFDLQAPEVADVDVGEDELAHRAEGKVGGVREVEPLPAVPQEVQGVGEGEER